MIHSDGLARNGRSFRAAPSLDVLSPAGVGSLEGGVELLYAEVSGPDLERIPGGARKYLLVPWPEGVDCRLALDAERIRLDDLFRVLDPPRTGDSP